MKHARNGGEKTIQCSITGHNQTRAVINLQIEKRVKSKLVRGHNFDS